MKTNPMLWNNRPLNFDVFNSLRIQFLNVLRKALLISLLIGLIWLPGFFDAALAIPDLAALPAATKLQPVGSTSLEGERLTALIGCLPKQLSQPSFKRALSEMGDDQLERAFNLKANPKLSLAELELKGCMNRKGFAA